MSCTQSNTSLENSHDKNKSHSNQWPETVPRLDGTLDKIVCLCPLTFRKSNLSPTTIAESICLSSNK